MCLYNNPYKACNIYIICFLILVLSAASCSFIYLCFDIITNGNNRQIEKRTIDSIVKNIISVLPINNTANDTN